MWVTLNKTYMDDVKFIEEINETKWIIGFTIKLPYFEAYIIDMHRI